VHVGSAEEITSASASSLLIGEPALLWSMYAGVRGNSATRCSSSRRTPSAYAASGKVAWNGEPARAGEPTDDLTPADGCLGEKGEVAGLGSEEAAQSALRSTSRRSGCTAMQGAVSL
jgi:hypothetical protein